jgi:hypothetical protein
MRPRRGWAFAPSRYHKISHDADAIQALFGTLFLEAHPRPLKRVIIDLDATDDPLHGHQEGRFFHGYYDFCRVVAAIAVSSAPASLAVPTKPTRPEKRVASRSATSFVVPVDR